MRYLKLILVTMVLMTIAGCAKVQRLPAPSTHQLSFELLANSRNSVHNGFEGTLPRSVISNVIWAMNCVPKLGGYREFYVATPDGLYRYDPAQHALALHHAGDARSVTGSAFEVGISAESDIEVGLACQAGLLAGTVLMDSGVAACPMARPAEIANRDWKPAHPIQIVNVYGRMAGGRFKTGVQAQSSDSSLPPPFTSGRDTFELLLKRLRQDSVFTTMNPSPVVISQLLWAGYGVTPHTASRNQQGLTVPSAMARYFLTGKIYVARDGGVQRYHNRLPPGTDLTTSDHRLESLTADDRRAQLRAACPRLPATAPLYIVIAPSDTARGYAAQEAGYSAFQFLMQAAQLGLGGCLTEVNDPAQQAAIRTALGLPEGELPMLVFSVGMPKGRKS